MAERSLGKSSFSTLRLAGSLTGGPIGCTGRVNEVRRPSASRDCAGDCTTVVSQTAVSQLALERRWGAHYRSIRQSSDALLADQGQR
jgi:hypothetical protein